jgi:hypothetical protein
MLLAKLLETLSEEEILKIRQGFRLSERSRLIFERIVISPESPPDVASLVKAISVTKANFYSICSEIVDECVRILAPSHEFSTMKFFHDRFLYRPFVTEVLRREKKVLSSKDKAAIEAFYDIVFLWMSDFPISTLEIPKIEKFGEKLFQSKRNPTPGDKLAIELKIVYLKICELPAWKKMTLTQMATRSRALLDPFIEPALASDNLNAKYYYYLSEWKACVFRKELGPDSIEWVRKTLDLIKTDPSFFPAGGVQTFELLLAYERAMRSDGVSEALTIYKKYYNGQTPETSRGALFLERFARVALLAGDYETSKKMVGELERFQFVRTTPGIYLMVLVSKAMVCIAQGEYKEAETTVKIAREWNAKYFFLPWEVEIRGLETLLSFKQGNVELANILSQRNIKWLRNRRIPLAESAWIYFYQTIEALVLFKETGEPIRPSLLNHFHIDFKAEHPSFYLMLRSDLG